MAYRRKNNSRSLNKLRNRTAALENIDPDIDLGSGLTVAELQALADEYEGLVNDYNGLLAQADAKRNALRHKNKEVADACERIFKAVIARFGRDSDEYEMVGGVRKSEISYGNGNADPETYSVNGSDGGTDNSGSGT